MAHNNMLKVNGTKIKSPSQMDLSLQDISSADAGRTQDGLMHKDRIAKKRKIVLSWNGVSKEDAHTILNAFKNEYFSVNYYDPWDGQTETRTFYSGDQSAPIKVWNVNNKVYSQVSFDIIER